MVGFGQIEISTENQLSNMTEKLGDALECWQERMGMYGFGKGRLKMKKARKLGQIAQKKA